MALKASEKFTRVSWLRYIAVTLISCYVCTIHVQISKFDVEELMVDNFYFFDKNTKRKNELAEYCTFCDVQYRKILKYVSTRWLSLEMAIDHTLQQYVALQSFFLSESKTEYNV